MPTIQIESIIQCDRGNHAAWDTVTEPIPDKVLVYAIDSRILKLGNGVDQFSNLPIFLDLNKVEDSKKLQNLFPLINIHDAGKLLTPNENGDQYIPSLLTIDDLITMNQCNVALDEYSDLDHNHSDTYFTEGEVIDLFASDVYQLDEDIITWLVARELSLNNRSNMDLPDGYIDDFGNSDNIDLENTKAAYTNRTFRGSLVNTLTNPQYGLADAAACIVDDEIFVFGGKDPQTNLPISTFKKYSITTDTWTQLTPSTLPPSRYASRMIHYDGALYLYGGRDEASLFGDLWKYTISSNTWKQLSLTNIIGSTMPDVRTGMSLVVLNDKMYLFGGDRWGVASPEMWEYNFLTDAWTNKLAASIGSTKHACNVYNNTLVISGGIDSNENHISSIRIYDPTNNTWSSQDHTGEIQLERYSHNAHIVGNELFLIGGKQKDSNLVNSSYGYFNNICKLNLDNYTYSNYYDIEFDVSDMATIVTTDSDSYILSASTIDDGSTITSTLKQVNLVDVGELTLIANEKISTRSVRSGRVYVRMSSYGTLNTDTTLSLSRDNGVTWVPVTLEKSALSTPSIDVVVGSVKFDSVPDGNSLKWKIESNTKAVIHGIRINW